MGPLLLFVDSVVTLQW